MSNSSCVGCTHRHERVVGLVELPFNEGFVDKVINECRRFPPTQSFWGTAYPRPAHRCGEFEQPPTTPEREE